MNEFAVIPFTVKTTNLRVIKSNIGKVIPVVDIAKAIDYDQASIKRQLDRNKELFDGTVVVVTTSTVQDNRGSEQTRDYDVKALNVFGVTMLMAKLDYTRIKDPEKRASVLRFQKWAMNTLGKAALGKKEYKSLLGQLDKVPAGLRYQSLDNAAKSLNVSVRTIRRYIKKGLLKPYKKVHMSSTKYAIPYDQILNLKNESNEANNHD